MSSTSKILTGLMSMVCSDNSINSIRAPNEVFPPHKNVPQNCPEDLLELLLNANPKKQFSPLE